MHPQKQMHQQGSWPTPHLRKILFGGQFILMLSWPMQIIPNQDYTRLLIYAAVGVIVGLLFLIVIILPLGILLRNRRRRKKALLAATEPVPTIPGLQPAEVAASPVSSPDQDQTKPILPITESETLETVPVITVDNPDTKPVSGERPANVNWQIAGLTDVGMKRELNEDDFLMIEAETPEASPYGLYAVADGMGGHERGEVASRLTLETIWEQFTQRPPPLESALFDEWLKSTALAANAAVLARQDPKAKDKKMGSTLVMALVVEQQAHIVNVGDSRAYRLNSEGIQQISQDHSLVERLVQIGQISREEARVHRQRNVIYSTIGDKSDPEVGLYHITLQPGDRLLLCSDGLNNMLTDEQILAISQTHASPVKACKMMVEAAKFSGGKDNITAIIVQMDTE
jgi:serine/threonine protein phosphatase PrpC